MFAPLDIWNFQILKHAIMHNYHPNIPMVGFASPLV